jgi:predicted ester cyclase
VSSDHNKAIVLRYFAEAVNEANLDVIDELFSDEFIYHGRPGESKREQQERVRADIADIHADVEQVLAEGDLVAVRYLYRFTHSRPLAGVAPTGKRVTMTSIDLFRLAEGKVVEQWSNEDWHGVLEQIGAVPAEA